MLLFAEQLLNGLQYAALLFLLASGLTLVFGVMNVINLAHGSFYMVGAFCAAWTLGRTGSFGLAVLAAVISGAVYAVLVERLVIARLYNRGHLDQVLATFGIALFTDELVSVVFGRTPPTMNTPAFLAGSVTVLPGLTYPVMRLAFIATGIAVAVALWLVIGRTRIGMLVRAGADDAGMVDALGVETRTLFASVFAVSGLLCGLAGVMAAPLTAVEIGMGDRILISTLVVIVVGGVGSIRGSLLGALLIGLTDSFGRAYVPGLLSSLLPPAAAATVIPAFVSGLTFLLMVAVLIVRPRGLAG